MNLRKDHYRISEEAGRAFAPAVEAVQRAAADSQTPQTHVLLPRPRAPSALEAAFKNSSLSRMSKRMHIRPQLKQLSTTDLLALASMKNAAKCDK